MRLDQDLMITVGIEPQIRNSFELEAIASLPRTANMFYVQQFQDLSNITNDVVSATCNSTLGYVGNIAELFDCDFLDFLDSSSINVAENEESYNYSSHACMQSSSNDKYHASTTCTDVL